MRACISRLFRVTSKHPPFRSPFTNGILAEQWLFHLLERVGGKLIDKLSNPADPHRKYLAGDVLPLPCEFFSRDGSFVLAMAYEVHVLDVYDHYRFRAIQNDSRKKGKDGRSGFLAVDDSWQDGYLEGYKGALSRYFPGKYLFGCLSFSGVVFAGKEAVDDKLVDDSCDLGRQAGRVDAADDLGEGIELAFERQELVDNHHVVFPQAALAAEEVSFFVTQCVAEFLHRVFEQYELSGFFHGAGRVGFQLR